MKSAAGRKGSTLFSRSRQGYKELAMKGWPARLSAAPPEIANCALRQSLEWIETAVAGIYESAANKFHFSMAEQSDSAVK
jgi:hypothetical protein